MEENNRYPEQNEEQHENQEAVPDADAGLGHVQEVQFAESQNPAEGEADYRNSSWQSGVYQNSAQSEAYQNGTYQSSAQSDVYQNGTYQNSAQGDVYQNGIYQYGTQGNTYQDAPYQNSGYADGAYSGSGYQNFGGDYRQYNQQYSGMQPWQDNRLQLEEPVKVSEWVLALVLMMIPCVNIIMMFVWAFSSTEKKSKSNFFKAYLIFFGISMGVMLLIWVFIVILALAL